MLIYFSLQTRRDGVTTRLSVEDMPFLNLGRQPVENIDFGRPDTFARNTF